ncbi:ABC transporter permease [Singulisphaera sp. PoT]|uniref:ABC transporter permease n=1 Tax=Singulisphaera sp. PoT TaxID=3411797 RepID=UPI003BF506C6
MTRDELKIVGKLAMAQARRHPGRVLLTSLSTIAAACIVVWVVSGYDAMVGEFGNLGEEYVGRYEMLLVPTRGDAQELAEARSAPRIQDALLGEIRRDPAVALVDPVFETTARVSKPGSSPARTGPGDGLFELPPQPAPGAPPASGPIIMGGKSQMRNLARSPILVGTDSREPLHRIVEGRWFDPASPGLKEGAITRDSADQLGIKVGDEVSANAGGFGPPRGSGPLKIKVVGIVEQPKRLPGPKFMVGLPPSREGALQGGPASHALYVPREVAGGAAVAPLRVSYAGVVLKPGNKADDFLARWAIPLAKGEPSVQIRTPQSVDGEVDDSTTFETVRAQAYSAMGISLLAALFIIFTTLSMGVDERIRQFAMLRAVALSRGQVALMVVMEGVMLGLIGWAGGLLAGWGLIAAMARLRPESVSEGATLGTWSVLLSGACALGGSLAASVLPAWRATRVAPLEAMVPRPALASGRLSALLAVAGLLLIAVNPLVVFFIPMPDTARYGISAAVGCTAMAIGFMMLAPSIIAATERLLGPVLARCLGLNGRLLATQLSANMGRTVGTTVAMTIGLGLFVAMQTWGYSMLAPFTPGDWSPDLVVSMAPAGVPESQVDAIRHVPGLIPERFLPLAVKQVKFEGDPTGFKVRSSSTRQDNCVMIGLDPEAAFGGDDPVFGFGYAEGTRADAIARLKRGDRTCLVPDHFARESGLHLGDRFKVIPPGDPAQPLEYEIAGVVSMPGWHWMTKVGFRRGRAAGLMFAPYERIKSDFKVDRISMFWGDTSGSRSEDRIKADLEVIAKRGSDPKAAAAMPVPEGMRQLTGPRRAPAASVTLRSAESVRTQIRQRADNIIWALSELPLITLLVTSLGLVNTVLSSIRARRWDMGVLRALGVTRLGLFKLIVAEAFLIGVVVCVLSLGFGAMAGYCGTGVTRYINIRGGQYTPLIIPWSKLSVGFAITLGLCFLASLWPAYRTGRAEPLKLLQAGRAAA